MAFHKTSCDMHLTTKSGSTFLAAICNNDEGSGLTTDIPLDKFLGNEDGHFIWNGKDFSKSARNITFEPRGPEHRPILCSELRNESGVFVPCEVDLSEHIGNVEGELVFDGYEGGAGAGAE